MKKQRTPLLTAKDQEKVHQAKTENANPNYIKIVKTIKNRIKALYRAIGDQPRPLHYIIAKLSVTKDLIVIPLEEAVGPRCASYFIMAGIALSSDEIKDIRDFARSTGPDDIRYIVQTQVGFNGTSFGFPFLKFSRGENGAEGERKRIARYSDNPLFGDYKVQGSLEKWQELLGFAKGNSRLIFLFAVACAGPLSGLLGHLPMLFIMYAPEGGDGKSAMAAVVSSLWGWNSEECGFGQSCNGTPIGIQGMLASRRHSLTVLDEPATNDDPKACAQLLTAVAFQSASGVGRLRQRSSVDGAAQIERTQPMETVVVVTSNATAADIVGWTGATVGSQHHDRMVTICAPDDAEQGFFEALHGARDIPELVGRMKAIAAANHGVAAQRLVRHLEALWAKDQDKFKWNASKLERVYLNECAKFAPGQSLARLNRSFARVYVAGVLGSAAGVLTMSKKCILGAVLKCHRDCLRFRTDNRTATTSVITPSVTLGVIARFWVEKGKALPTLNSSIFDRSNPPSRDQAFISNEKSRKYLALTNEHFVALCNGKRQADPLKAHLAAKGLLLQESAGGSAPRNVVKRQIGQGLEARFVLIAIEALEEVGKDS